ncbi:MAG TPA: hypothetical protein VIK89_02725, partial [Cytophagaceae bacterium]
MFTKHVKGWAGKIIYLIISMVLIFSSCKKEEETVPSMPGTEPVTEQPQKPSNPPVTNPPDSGSNKPGTDECMVTTAADHNATIPDQYIITFKGDITPEIGIKSNPIDKLLAKHGISASKVLKQFEGIKTKGIVAKLTPEDLNKLKTDSKIQHIEQDR